MGSVRCGYMRFEVVVEGESKGKDEVGWMEKLGMEVKGWGCGLWVVGWEVAGSAMWG